MIPLLEKAINQLKQLPEIEQTRIASLILNNLKVNKNKTPIKDSDSKLSEVLLLPELEEGEEEIFTRNQDRGRSLKSHNPSNFPSLQFRESVECNFEEDQVSFE